MEKEQDFFSKLVESFPKEYVGLVIVAAGALFFIGACRRWKWVLDMTGQRSAHPFGFLTLMQDWFGDNGVRIGVMIMGAIIMVCGLVLYINVMYMEISDLLLSQTDNYPHLQPRMEKLVAEIKYLVESCQPLAAYEVLEERAKDTELLRFVTSTIEAHGELPTLKQRDYPAYMMLIALSQDSHVVAFLLDYLTFAYIRNYQVEELLLLSDVLYLLNSRNVLLNGLYNFVCKFFRDERRDVTKRRERRISDQEFARAERNMPHMGERSFMENVRIKACGVYTVKELARECGMAPGSFYRKFEKEFGVTPGSWMDAQRIADIKYLLHSTTLTLTEIAKRTGFATPSSLSHYCVKHLHFTPGKLREFS